MLDVPTEKIQNLQQFFIIGVQKKKNSCKMQKRGKSVAGKEGRMQQRGRTKMVSAEVTKKFC